MPHLRNLQAAAAFHQAAKERCILPVSGDAQIKDLWSVSNFWFYFYFL